MSDRRLHPCLAGRLAVVMAAALCDNPPRASAQLPTPTYNDLAWATAPLDAGGTATLRLDFWHATSTTERAPLLIWIHGGGWQAGTYNNPPSGLAALLDAGFAVASIEYRLSGVAIFPAQIHDVKGAVRFLRARADDYDLDPSRFAAWGSSAGGHLTALLATSGDSLALEGTTGGNLNHASTVQAAVDYFGPIDLLLMNADVTTPPGSGINHDAATSPESHLIGFDGPGEGIGVLRANLTNPTPPYPEKAALVALTNPLNFLDVADPPTFIAHGTLDATVPQKQSARLADALTAVGVEHVLRPVIGAGHGFGNQTATVNSEAIAFLAEHLQHPPGDFNRDHAIDGRDFLTWQLELGTTPTLPGAGADGNVDGLVNDADLLVWQSNFGAASNGLAAPISTPTPEPPAAVFLAAAFAATLAAARRGRFRLLSRENLA